MQTGTQADCAAAGEHYFRKINAEGEGKQLYRHLSGGHIHQLGQAERLIVVAEVLAIEVEHFRHAALETGLIGFVAAEFGVRQGPYQQAFHLSGADGFGHGFVKNSRAVVGQHLVDDFVKDALRKTGGFLRGASSEKIKLAGALVLLFVGALKVTESPLSIAAYQGRWRQGGRQQGAEGHNGLVNIRMDVGLSQPV
jgi:hypothetical protein